MAENETPKVGDTVYGNFGRYGRVDVREGKVVKVTPSGRLNVDFGGGRSGQFKDGRQVGGDVWHPHLLIDRAQYDGLVVRSIEQKAVAALIARLRDARFATKAEAVGLAEEIRALAEAIPDTYRP